MPKQPPPSGGCCFFTVAAQQREYNTPLLLTGDNDRAAHAVARAVGITEVHAALLYDRKYK